MFLALIFGTVRLSSEIRNELKSVETEIKYAGYLDQQQRAIDRLKKASSAAFPIGSITTPSADCRAKCRRSWEKSSPRR